MDLFPVDLYYENVGTGIPVVLIHGFPLNHQIWEPVLPILSEKVNVILPDLRGHGRSPATDGIYPMRLMA
jgi:pimeloyl-ACP methyl ester carboxylesterase